MSLRTLERDAPSLFKKSLPEPVQLVVFCVLALVLMVADARLHITNPVRQAIATALLPAQWALLRPLRALGDGLNYVETVEAAQSAAQDAQRQLAAMGLQARQAQELEEENRRLRELLQLRPRLQVPALAAEVVYESPDNYTRRVILDKGQVAGVLPGSPVVDERGVLGQVVRVQPFTSEVRLLVDRDLAIPIAIERTGVRGVVYGRASNLSADVVELRYMPGDVDVQEGDMLTTSGIDGVYPAGLPVARVALVERQGATAFLRVEGQPLARMQGARHVMVLTPWQEALAAQLPAADEVRALVAPQPEATKKAREDKSAQRRAGSRLPVHESKEATP